MGLNCTFFSRQTLLKMRTVPCLSSGHSNALNSSLNDKVPSPYVCCVTKHLLRNHSVTLSVFVWQCSDTVMRELCFISVGHFLNERKQGWLQEMGDDGVVWEAIIWARGFPGDLWTEEEVFKVWSCYWFFCSSSAVLGPILETARIKTKHHSATQATQVFIMYKWTMTKLLDFFFWMISKWKEWKFLLDSVLDLALNVLFKYCGRHKTIKQLVYFTVPFGEISLGHLDQSQQHTRHDSKAIFKTDVET